MNQSDLPGAIPERWPLRLLRLCGKQRYTLALLALLGVFALSSIPKEFLPKFPGWDKRVHGVEYFILGLILLNITTRGFVQIKLKPALLALGGVMLVALLDETNQIWVPGRAPDRWDLLASALGGLLAVTTVWLARVVLYFSGKAPLAKVDGG